MAMVNLEYKDEKILQLTNELNELKKTKSSNTAQINDTNEIEMELQQCKEEMELLRNNYDQEIEQLKAQLNEVESA